MNAAVAKAIRAYRAALRRQAKLSEDQRWTMGKEIKALKAAAYAEMEYAKIRR